MPPIIASAESDRPRELPDADIHNAVCAFVVDLGMYPDQHFGKVTHRVMFCFEIEQKMADGRPFMLSKEYTLSLFEKATLFKHLTSWKGSPLSAEELKGFDLETRVGKPCRLNVIHRTAKSGSVYANIDAVLPPDKKAEPLKVFATEPPAWFETKRKEYAAAMARYEGGSGPETGGGLDEIPFNRFDP